MRAPRRQCGSTLIEALVSILILSFGVLATGALQAYAVAGSKLASHRATASMLASQAADLVRANSAGLAAGNYDLASYLTDAAPLQSSEVDAARCDFPSCTAASLAAYDLARLRYRVRAELPKGGLQFTRAVTAGVASTSEIQLWIVWLEPKLFQRSADSSPDTVEKDFDACPAEAKTLSQIPRCFFMLVGV